ncbi:MAG: hypothetical protein IJY85_01835 [Ruminococcus sp.]|nr:hypothetical protein [Ruminococcus sp.]
MDSYAEYLVKRQPTAADMTKKTLILVGGSAVTVIFLLLTIFYMPLLLFVACAAGYGTWWLFTNQYIEYEYLLTNGELDIDKIIGKRKRVRLLTVPVSAFTEFGKEEDGVTIPEDVTAVLAAGEGMETYAADFQDDSMGAVRLIFSPNEKMLDTMKPYLRASVRR